MQNSLANAAVETYKLYRAFVDAGFTEEQALNIIVNLMYTMLKNPTEESSPMSSLSTLFS